MGWVQKEVITDSELLKELKQTFKSKFDIEYATKRDFNGSVCEMFTDYIRDYYDVTLTQCSRVLEQLKNYYGIKKFYATD